MTAVQATVRRAQIWLIWFALVGFAASLAAAYVHVRLLRDPAYVSICDVGATFSCSQVYASAFSSVAGVPVAVLGVVFFAVTSALAIGGLWGPPTVQENVPGYLFVASTLALALILYLGYASFVLLKLVCVLCLITYTAVVGLFLLSGAVVSFPMSSLPSRARQDLRLLMSSPIAIIICVLLLGGTASAVALFPRASLTAGGAPQAAAAAPAAAQDQRAEFERWYTAQPRVPLIVPAEGAKVVVVKFNDYQCPPCRQSHLDYKPIFAKYQASNPGAVRLVLKDFPLESECNARVNTNLHPAGCEAAAAVRLARERGRAEPLEDWIFSNQPTLTPAAVRQAAREVGQVADFDGRYPLVLEQVKADTVFGGTLGVKSTPTFFVNGVRIEGALPPVYFDQAIAYELARAQ
jgi:uncharacterized membrane protein/protein-disulfide isomerase